MDSYSFEWKGKKYTDNKKPTMEDFSLFSTGKDLIAEAVTDGSGTKLCEGVTLALKGLNCPKGLRNPLFEEWEALFSVIFVNACPHLAKGVEEGNADAGSPSS